MLYDVSLKSLPKTSSRTINCFTAADINSIGELLEHIPFRYEDYREQIKIAELHQYDRSEEIDNEFDLLSTGKVSIVGEIEKKTNIFARRGFSMQKIILADDSGKTTITWFNQPFLLRLFKEGSQLAISGSVKKVNGVSILQPENYEEVTENDIFIHTRRIVPIYSSIKGVSLRTLREKMHVAVKLYAQESEECLPSTVLEKITLPNMRTTMDSVHFPESVKTLALARERMSFNELFCIQLKTHLIRSEWKKQKLDKKMAAEKIQNVEKFIATLPYKLTNAQHRSIQEITHDMSKLTPMNRLLQGDVGSGKTVVTLAAALFAYYNGTRTLYMAPTEILAQQHSATILQLCTALPEAHRPHLCLLTAHNKPTPDEVQRADIIIGTHALITTKQSFDSIGLVVIDEQHKFGVAQRAALKNRGLSPHLLSLTATPIPRTVLLTLYGELDISLIDEFPIGRKEIKTYVTPDSKRKDAYIWMRKELAQKRQAFVVCPFIEESESETLQSVKAATEEIKKLQVEFNDFNVALLHGKLKSDEKDAIMKSFDDGSLDILVSTPVVEVGIDVPNATIILIEGSERFGLAQLHQLRGRVGRSDIQSYCLLFTTSQNEKTMKRLKYFASTNNGFELAKYDLKHRGGGNIFSTQQHGYSPIALETLMDNNLIEHVQQASKKFISLKYSYKDFPYLKKRLESFMYSEVADN